MTYIHTARLTNGIEAQFAALSPTTAPVCEKSRELATSLAYAVGTQGATPELGELLATHAFFGEVDLRLGTVHPVRGLVPMIEAVIAHGGPSIVVVPRGQAHEVRHLSGHAVDRKRGIGLTVLLASTRGEVLSYLWGAGRLGSALDVPPRPAPRSTDVPVLEDIRGHEEAKATFRAAMEARQNVLFVGSPGSGKTMFARRAAGLLAPRTFAEIDLGRSIASAAGLPAPSLRPFRAPHHTASMQGVIGGGIPTARPGEITLAHTGVLFLDEILEFRRDVLDAVFTAQATGVVRFGRGGKIVTMPAQPVIVAATSPCPCGFVGDPQRVCKCSASYCERWDANLANLRKWFPVRIDLPRVASRDFARV